MVQVLENAKRPNWASLLLGGAGQGFARGIDSSMEQKNKQSLLQQQLLAKQGSEEMERIRPLEAGLQTLEEMREIKDQGNLGWKIANPKGLLTSKGREERSRYEQLGKSLISLASNIPIRNQKEFDTLSARIFDPTLTEAEIDGTLRAMENIIKRSLGHKDVDISRDLLEDKSKNMGSLINRSPSVKSERKRRALGDIFK